MTKSKRITLKERFFKLTGLRKDPSSKLGVRLSLLTLVWIGVLAGGGGAGTFLWTSRSKFCSTCHNIRPYYESWTWSTHKDVPCTACHFIPGTVNYLKRKLLAVSEIAQYVTNTFEPRPRSHVEDASCLRPGCHTKEKISESLSININRDAKTTMEIRFDHGKHLKKLGDKKLRCVSCHLQVTHKNHFEIRPGVCFLCHLHGATLDGISSPQLVGRDRPCTVCHDAPVGDIRLATGTYNHAQYINRGADCRSCHQDSIQGAGDVNIENCRHCHGKVSRLEQIGDPKKMHEAHVATHYAECFDCHHSIEHGLPEKRIVSMDECSACHLSSHDPTKQMYEGWGGEGLMNMPSQMHRAHVDCQGCHHPDRVGLVPEGKKPSEVACKACHELKYMDDLEAWKKKGVDQIAETTLLLDEADLAILALTGKAKSEALEHMRVARHNLDLVSRGKPVHNINYAIALLNVAKARAKEAIKMAGEK